MLVHQQRLATAPTYAQASGGVHLFKDHLNLNLTRSRKRLFTCMGVQEWI